MTALAELVRLEDPDFYWTDAPEVFARARRESPVFWYEPLGTWAITKYDDVRYASRTPELFSVQGGILLNDVRHGSVVSHFFPPDALPMSLTDPPDHRDIRRTIVPPFLPQAVAAMEPRVRAMCRALLDERVRPGEPLDWVDEVAALLPLQVISALLGVEDGHVGELRYWSDEMIKMGAALPADALAQAAKNLEPMRAFLADNYEHKRTHPADDLMSTLLGATIGGEPLSAGRLSATASSVLVAGNETTRNLLAGAMWAFAHHPEQFDKLVADPSLAAYAADEALRWFVPVPGFLRTVTKDTEVRGQALEAGQHIYLSYFSANRDEDVFIDADTFDIGRKPDPMHVAFGFGTHVCAGAPLARLEARVMFEELAARFTQVELAGEPQRVSSVLQHGFHHLPLTVR